jgi:hypothetical protein
MPTKAVAFKKKVWLISTSTLEAPYELKEIQTAYNIIILKIPNLDVIILE